MNLDEIEKLARELDGYDQRFGIAVEIHNGAISEKDIANVARALLAMLPVVQAAVDLHGAYKRTAGDIDRDVAESIDELWRVTDTMRKELSK